MRTAIIVNDAPQNVSLLRFTQTKLFFDAYNVGINYFQDCQTVSNYEEAESIAKDNDVILETGEYLTTHFWQKHKHSKVVVYTRDSDHVYKFDKNQGLQNISDNTKRTGDRTIINYEESMVTTRFNPMTITLHNESVGGLSRSQLAQFQDANIMSQRSEEKLWTFRDSTFSMMGSISDTSTDGVTPRRTDNRMLVVKKSYQNVVKMS